MDVKPVVDVVGTDLSPFARPAERLLDLPDRPGFARALSFFHEYPVRALSVPKIVPSCIVWWLPESLIEADLARESLVRTGSNAWTVALDIRLHRNTEYSNHLTRSIWAFLKDRQSKLPSDEA